MSKRAMEDLRATLCGELEEIRDSLGRYSRADARERMHEQLEDMMRDADSDATRDAIRRCMEQIDRA